MKSGCQIGTCTCACNQEATEYRLCKCCMLNTSLHKSCNCIHQTCMIVSSLSFLLGVYNLLFWKECGKHQQYYNTNYSMAIQPQQSFAQSMIVSVMYDVQSIFLFLLSYTIFRAAIKKTFLFILTFFISTITWHIIPHFICDILFYFYILLPLLRIVALSVLKISGRHIRANQL